MKPALNAEAQRQARRAKEILRRLWDASGIKQVEVLRQLESRGLTLKKTTFSMWLTTTGDNVVRPKAEFIAPLVAIFNPGRPLDELEEQIDEINALLGYDSGLKTSEMLMNQLSEQLEQELEHTLSHSEAHLRGHIGSLEALLADLEPRLFAYDKGAPMLRVREDDKYLVRTLLGLDSLQQASRYKVKEGYEIPLTQIQSLDTLTEVLNAMNEGIRVLRAYVERTLLTHSGEFDYARVDDFVGYAWEIADRLLNNNRTCQSIPAFKRTLLRLMATCWGVRYLLRGQEGSVSEVEFQNILRLKGKTSQADIACSVAVYMGILARQILKTYRGRNRVEQGLALAERAAEMLASHPELPTEQEAFYYKKELANLCYDSASLLLWAIERQPELQPRFQALMAQAAQAYGQVLGSVNLFYLGLTEQRATYIRCFYVISLCWTHSNAEACVREINKLSGGQQLNSHFWTVQMAKAVAFCALAERFAAQASDYQAAARTFVAQAKLVPGLENETNRELQQDYLLSKTFKALPFF